MRINIYDHALPRLTAACAGDGTFGAADRVEMGEDAGAVVWDVFEDRGRLPKG
jgi:hypothetical protein